MCKLFAAGKQGVRAADCKSLSEKPVRAFPTVSNGVASATPFLLSGVESGSVIPDMDGPGALAVGIAFENRYARFLRYSRYIMGINMEDSVRYRGIATSNVRKTLPQMVRTLKEPRF